MLINKGAVKLTLTTADVWENTISEVEETEDKFGVECFDEEGTVTTDGTLYIPLKKTAEAVVQYANEKNKECGYNEIYFSNYSFCAYVNKFLWE